MDYLHDRPEARRHPSSILESGTVGGDAGDGISAGEREPEPRDWREARTSVFSRRLPRSALAASRPMPPDPTTTGSSGTGSTPLRRGSKRRRRAAAPRQSRTPPRFWSATSRAGPGWAGSARTRMLINPRARQLLLPGGRARPTWNSRPTSRSPARTAAPAPPASTPAPRRHSPSRASSMRRSASAT